MKKYKRIALLMVLFGALFTLTPQRALSQNKTSVSTNSTSLIIVFPLRIEDTIQFEQINTNNLDALTFLRVMSNVSEEPQSDANGNTFPEALSLDTLLSASFRAKTKNTRIVNYNIASFLSQIRTIDTIQNVFLINDFDSVNLICFNMYEIKDDTVRLCSLLLRRDGIWAEYVSDSATMFELLKITESAVAYFLQRGLFDNGAAASASAQSANNAILASENLPNIKPWENKNDYEQAQRSFKFAIGGTAIGISLTFLSAGMWQMFREASYRNSAFSSATTISGIVAGSCAAVSAAFLTFTVTDAIKMLKATQ